MDFIGDVNIRGRGPWVGACGRGTPHLRSHTTTVNDVDSYGDVSFAVQILFLRPVGISWKIQFFKALSTGLIII